MAVPVDGGPGLKLLAGSPGYGGKTLSGLYDGGVNGAV